MYSYAVSTRSAQAQAKKGKGKGRIADDCHKFIMDLCTNARIVSDAMKFVTQQEEKDRDNKDAR